ncbi:MAG: Crp/Fnr family transcriptional regulator [Acidaminococcaceae bacterium]|jgi:CRP/FNR family cyclic AMP-dependent transcriptional regulator|nr:Crp/Fnr family transcriptional regulator [Acidaminococcaceae bacterium]
MSSNSGLLTFPVICHRELEAFIKKHSTELHYENKDVISAPGDPLGYIFYLKSGRTRHIILNKDGNEKVLYTLSQGWFFGEVSSDLDVHTSLYTIAENSVVIYKINEKDYHILVDTYKPFRDAILHSYAQKLLILRYALEDLAFTSCKDRLKRLFCSVADASHLIDNQWYNLKVKYTQYDLGIIVGGARVTVSKLINELYSENVLRLINHKMQINKAAYSEYIKEMEK